MIQNPSHFKFSSDYVVPGISYYTEGSVYSDGYYYGGCKKIKHNLPYTPLFFGIWSINSDYSSAHGITNGRLGIDDGWFAAAADSSYIYIRAWKDMETPIPATFYYKIYAYAPPDYQDITHQQDQSNFLFNTDNDYLQLYMAGKVTPSQKVTAIDHNLGYTPIYRIWITDDFDFWENGGVTIRGLTTAESLYDGWHSQSIESFINMADSKKLYVNYWRRNPDASDFAYYHIYTEAG